MPIKSIVLLLLTSMTLKAQRLLDGYILLLTGDTVRVNIRPPRLLGKVDLERCQRFVRYLDTVKGDYTRMKAKQLQGYAFYDDDNLYLYEAIPGKTFYRVKQAGKNVKLLYHFRSGIHGSKTEQYILQKPNGEMARFKYTGRNNIMKKLTALFKSDPAILNIISGFDYRGPHYLENIISKINDG